MRAADTNVLVRLLVRDDEEQVAKAEAFVERGVWAPLLAVAEAVWVLTSVHDRGRRQVAAGIRQLLDNERLTFQDPDVVESALTLFEGRSTVDFTDCLILESARKAGHLPLGTFDRDLAKLDGAERL